MKIKTANVEAKDAAPFKCLVRASPFVVLKSEDKQLF